MGRTRIAPIRLGDDVSWAYGPAGAWSSSQANLPVPRAATVEYKCSPARPVKREAKAKTRRKGKTVTILPEKEKRSPRPKMVVIPPLIKPKPPYESPEMQARINYAAELRLQDMVHRYSRVVTKMTKALRPDNYSYLREATEYVAYLSTQLAAGDLQNKVKAARAPPPDWMLLLSFAR